MNASYKPDKYRWHYLHEQTADEVIMLKQFDSKNGVKAKCKLCSYVDQGNRGSEYLKQGILLTIEIVTPHVAFPLENVTEGTPRRESIEVRALVFTRPKGTES